jgi:hypothetical protein
MGDGNPKDLTGAPLAVCINDCELDHGQHPLDLVVLCFKVHCAFAEMRWGDAVERSCEIKSLLQGDAGNGKLCINTGPRGEDSGANPRCHP